MVLIIDNYDSFSYNLMQLIGVLTTEVKVVRNDEITVEQVKELSPDAIIISSGSANTDDNGICKELISEFSGKCPILGVGLGHQIICEHFGSNIIAAQNPIHGKATNLHIANGSPIFKGLPPLICGGRYHSTVVERDNHPDDILVIAEDNDGVIMAIKHRKFDIFGVQFQPESILTPDGATIIENFISIGGKK